MTNVWLVPVAALLLPIIAGFVYGLYLRVTGNAAPTTEDSYERV